MEILKLKTISLCAIGLMYSSSYAANCHINSIDNTNPWGPKLSFTCDESVNLTQSDISFDVTGGDITAAWGLEIAGADGAAAMKSTQTGQKILVDIGKHYNPEDDVIVNAGESVSFLYSPTALNEQISNFTVGQPAEKGMVSFKQAPESQEIPDNAIILLKDKNAKIAYQTTWQEISQKALSVSPGSYTIEAYVVAGDEHKPIEVVSANPISVAANKSAEVVLNYQKQQQIKLSINLDYPKPEDVSENKMYVKLINTKQATEEYTVEVPWNGSVNVQLKPDQTYALSADAITGSTNQYDFSFDPSSITTDATTAQYQTHIKVSEAPIKSYLVKTSVSHLPADKTSTITLSKDGKVVTSQSMKNGTQNLYLPQGKYEVSGTTILDGEYQYSLPKIMFTVKNCDECNTLNLVFNKESAGKTVRGWPDYIAMGAVTDANTTNTAQLKDRLVDAIFKYAGDGGNGDRGRLVYPIFTQNTYKLADELSKLNAHTTRPVMVVYTAEMSGGTNFDDFSNQKSSDEINNLILTKHFINLMLLSQTMQTEYTKYQKLAGSIVLNPDLMGMVQQQKLYTSLLGDNPTAIDVNNALKQAYWFVTTPHDWKLTLSNGQTLNIRNKTAEAFLQMAENGDLKPEGIYSPWDVKVPWENAATKLLQQYSGDISVNLPSFEDNFKGWIQATNWVIKSFAPDITFGWQENVWNANSATWVHNNLSQAQIQDEITRATVGLWQKAGLYNGQYQPDFLVFDKYERNPIPGEAGSGYIWNSRDWDNYLSYVQQMSEGLDNIPVMLWQIPGGHLQTTNESTLISHGATGPDYFLGNPDVSKDLSNLQAYIKNINLNDATYHCQTDNACLLPHYLKDTAFGNNYDWSKGNMDKAQASHVFAILWGGGSTTSVGTFPMDDNGWLAHQVNQYEAK